MIKNIMAGVGVALLAVFAFLIVTLWPLVQFFLLVALNGGRL